METAAFPLHGSSDTMANAPEATAEEAAVSLKLPPFWVNCPEAWFITVENYFRTRRIVSDAARFSHVVTALPVEISMSILDILRKPPPEDQYETLKATLIKRHSLSEEKRLEELLLTSDQGDRSPSQYYRDLELLATANTGVDANMLLKLWLRKLSPTIKIALTAAGKTDINEVLSLADKIWDVSNSQTLSIASTSSAPVSTNFPTEMVDMFSKLTLSINALQKEVSEIKQHTGERIVTHEHNEQVCPKCRNCSSSRNYNRYRSRSRSPNRAGTNHSPCWYHKRFGDQATRCAPPCNFTAKQNCNPNNNTLNN